VHVKWDEATAVLAGDALADAGFRAAVTDPALGPPTARVALVAALARAAGAQGMVLGQALDIAAETAAAPLTLEQITALQAGKTGALIRFSADGGGNHRRAPTPGPCAPMPRRWGWPSRSPTTSWM
jgi:farnesyl diphosphate synthase